MVGIVLVSHSEKLVEGLAELLAQLSSVPVQVAYAGGANSGDLGTSADKIGAAIRKVYSADGVMVLLDMGSAALSAEVAIEGLSKEQQQQVKISDAPLVEGAVLAVIHAGMGQSLAQIMEAVEAARNMPKNIG